LRGEASRQYPQKQFIVSVGLWREKLQKKLKSFYHNQRVRVVENDRYKSFFIGRSRNHLFGDSVGNTFPSIEESPSDLLDNGEGVDGLVVEDDYLLNKFFISEEGLGLRGTDSTVLDDPFILIVI
jgi:hypothetical protein